MGPPTCCPSWWTFNDSFLQEIKSRALSGRVAFSAQSIQIPPPTVDAIEALSLEVVELERFSQVTYDAFAGYTWMDALNVLEGKEPGVAHRLAPRLASQGKLRLVVTTNFDSMFETALESDGQEFQLFTTLDLPPTEAIQGPIVLKVHGSLTEPASLIDLANQKSLGLPSIWRDWLTTQFAEYPLLVLGFSGRDLALAEDYLGLFAASSQSPGIDWVSHPGSVVPPLVESLISLRSEFQLIEQQVDQYLADAGYESNSDTSSDCPESLEVSVWFDQWNVDALEALILAMRLMPDQEDRHTVRSAIRAFRSGLEARGALNVFEATHLILVSHQVGVDELEIAFSLLAGVRSDQDANRIESSLAASHIDLTWAVRGTQWLQARLDDQSRVKGDPGKEERLAGLAASQSALARCTFFYDREKSLILARSALASANEMLPSPTRSRRLAQAFMSLTFILSNDATEASLREARESALRAREHYLECGDSFGTSDANDAIQALDSLHRVPGA